MDKNLARFSCIIDRSRRNSMFNFRPVGGPSLKYLAGLTQTYYISVLLPCLFLAAIQ